MKTTNKILALSIIIVSTIVSKNSVFAQGCFSGLVPSPFHTEVQSANPLLDFTMEPSSPCSTMAGSALTGIGMNQSNPQYMLDILSDPSVPTNNDINISTASGAQNSAYRIGGNRVLWYNGEIRNIYVGVGAGNANTGIYQNTFVGGNVGINFSRL